MTRQLTTVFSLITAAFVCAAAGILQAQTGKTPENFQGSGGEGAPDFQKYVFWAYGLACLLLFLFTLRTISQCRNLQKRVDYLEGRFEKANLAGGEASDGTDGDPGPPNSD